MSNENENTKEQQYIFELLTQIKKELTNLRKQVKAVKTENEVEDFFNI